jgi:uncharacterized protein YjiS (DUF1127 family)
MPATTVLSPVRIARPRLTVRGLLAKLVRFDALYRSRMDLAALDDHLLRDVGLTRADVADELRRPLTR